VSRSGASIVAAMLLGPTSARAEFSFFLAIPTMLGAFVYDLYKNRGDMTADHFSIVAIGFAVSFVTAIIVVKTFLNYVTRHGFYAVRVVARDRRHARPDRAGNGEVAGRPATARDDAENVAASYIKFPIQNSNSQASTFSRRKASEVCQSLANPSEGWSGGRRQDACEAPLERD